MSIAKVIARAWRDADYKAKLLSNPHAAFAEAGVDIPVGARVHMVENTANTQHIVLPVAPSKASDLSIDQLEKIAGGKKPKSML